MRREGAMTGATTDIQRAAMVFGVVFAVVTVLGFIPGITTDYDRLTTFDDVGAKLLGIFGANVLENIIHGLYALAGFAAAASYAASRVYFIWGGIVYLAVWLYGILTDLSSPANFLGVNTAANWLHFALGVAMVALGFVLARRVAGARPASSY
jgi:Domain of unknown function (DUF4383)